MGRRLTDTERAEAVLHAVVHGDENAAARYGISVRTLRRYREEVRDPESELSAIVRRFGAALREAQGLDEDAAEERAEAFGAWLHGRIRELSDILLDKARGVNPAQPQAYEAVSGHVRDLLGHAAALDFLARTFGDPPPAGAAPATPPPEDDP